MRILHTSDWHLGRSFHREGLLGHQGVFVDHLLAVVESESVDLVVVSGDVYDRALPHVDAVRLADETFARLAAPGGFTGQRFLEECAPTAARPDALIEGLHIFTFNQIAETEAWRQDLLGSNVLYPGQGFEVIFTNVQNCYYDVMVEFQSGYSFTDTWDVCSYNQYNID